MTLYPLLGWTLKHRTQSNQLCWFSSSDAAIFYRERPLELFLLSEKISGEHSFFMCLCAWALVIFIGNFRKHFSFFHPLILRVNLEASDLLRSVRKDEFLERSGLF